MKLERFYTKFSYGNWQVIDRKTDKKIVGYSKSIDAKNTAKGLNRIRKKENITKMKRKLKTVYGYGYYLKK